MTLEFSRELTDDGDHHYLWQSTASGSDARSGIKSPAAPPSSRSVETQNDTRRGKCSSAPVVISVGSPA